MSKRLLVLLTALLTFMVAHAANSVLRDDHPDHYVVQRGDTLWGIAARFLNAPWLWPEIWQANPQVANPHLIYPGDVLNLSYLGGQPQITRADADTGPQIRTDDVQPIPALPLSEIEPFLKRMRVLEDDSWKHLPYVVAAEENRLRATEADYIYVRDLNDAQPGDRFAVVRPTLNYREARKYRPSLSRFDDYIRERPWYSADSVHARQRTRRPDRLLGYEVMEVAQAQYIRGSNPATLLLDDGPFEVRAGDLIVPLDSQPYDLFFHPHAPDAIPEGMLIMAVTEALAGVGKYQVVSLNRGARDGIANGQTYSVFRPGEEIHDRARFRSVNPLRDAPRSETRVTLPDEFSGHIMVFRVFNRMSYALVMEAQREIKPRDRLDLPYSL